MDEFYQYHLSEQGRAEIAKKAEELRKKLEESREKRVPFKLHDIGQRGVAES
jgi:hypothetical protein